MSNLSIQDCQQIYAAAIAAEACEGQAQAAKRALDAGEVDAFERVWRASAEWLWERGIEYVLTDGIGEICYDNGTLRIRTNYENSKRHGLCEMWHENGALAYRASYEKGKRHGLCEMWHENGDLSSRANYENDELIEGGKA